MDLTGWPDLSDIELLIDIIIVDQEYSQRDKGQRRKLPTSPPIKTNTQGVGTPECSPPGAANQAVVVKHFLSNTNSSGTHFARVPIETPLRATAQKHEQFLKAVDQSRWSRNGRFANIPLSTAVTGSIFG